MIPSPRGGGDRTLIVAAMIALLAGSALGSFRADDWGNLEIGRRALDSHWTRVWTTLRPDGFYRPLVDLWHGVMMRLWGLHPWPHLLPLALMLVLQTFLLARLARLRGASPALGRLVIATAWAQVNTYAWTALWPSNVTGGLMTTFLLVTLVLHHRAVKLAGQGRSPMTSVALAMLATALALVAKEEAVLIPVIVAWLEVVRWARLDATARRAALTSGIAIALVVACYVGLRSAFLPFPRATGTHYGLHLGMNWVRNLAFFAVHLGALPIVAILLTRVLYPEAWRAGARRGEAWTRAREAMLAGLGWALIGIQLFLLMRGHAYGWLYAPGLAVAFAVAHFVEWAAGVQARATSRALPAAGVIAAHWGIALLATVVGLHSVGWPRYRALAREAFAVMDRTLPRPPPHAHVVFLDPNPRETLSGRSLFNMVFGSAAGSALRLHYRRDDLTGEIIAGAPALAAVEHPPAADAVFLARGGRLTAVAGPTDSRPAR
jgi:hypothetical protein